LAPLVELLVEIRTRARVERDFALADAIRDALVGCRSGSCTTHLRDILGAGIATD